MCCLYCKHRSQSEKVSELLVLANPDLNEEVSRDEVIAFFKNMLTVVVQKPLLYL